ncbi:Alcohol dehydrogenase Transcription factor [Abeliophyllum distichum]|uniref:Alcohol dehydrogenase Transcription factor n=1 Tax=Abeliophyllum distichum TaxID=126358 RepID=A0ABD1V9X0_9LAMI
MDDTEDDARYPRNPYGINGEKYPIRNANYTWAVGNQYVEDDDEEDTDNEEDDGDGDGDDDDDGGSGVQRIGKDDYDGRDEDDDDDDNYGDLQRHPKKRKLKSLLSSYEFAPRVPKQSYAGQNPHMDWTEPDTVILLDAWGARFVEKGRKSLRSEEWLEVAEKVSQDSKIERTDTQCRNHLDTLKKKYKKEKSKSGETWGSTSKWVYFNKMDMLFSSLPQQAGLSCGLDSGEYVFMNPKVYLDYSNGLDEMRDSPGNSESTKEEEDNSEGLPPKHGQARASGASFKLLANSVREI